MPRTVLPLLRENYPAVAKDLLGPMVDILSAARSAFGGDLEKFYVLLIVAMRTVEDRRFAELDSAEVLSGQMKDYPSLTTNVRSIADSTGIPKETVRRKVSALVAEGWIARTDHQLSLTPRASTMMAEVRDPLLLFAARCYEIIRGLSAVPPRQT